MTAPATPYTPAELRARIRQGLLPGITSGYAPGYLQANLVVLPNELAADFRLYCERNPQPCPLIEQLAPGDPEPKRSAPGADLRQDISRYRVFRYGEAAEEPVNILHLWDEGLTAFLLGCSFGFEHSLVRVGIPMRHQETGAPAPTYVTGVETTSAGVFNGPLVVTMRPVADDKLALAAEVSGSVPLSHGAPVHVGDPAALGIDDLDRPDYGDPVEVRPGETPVYWACGVTPQAVAERVRLPLVITHSVGHMFITDLSAA